MYKMLSTCIKIDRQYSGLENRPQKPRNIHDQFCKYNNRNDIAGQFMKMDY